MVETDRPFVGYHDGFVKFRVSPCYCLGCERSGAGNGPSGSLPAPEPSRFFIPIFCLLTPF